MNNIEFRTDTHYDTGGVYSENPNLIKIDRTSAAYLAHSINRLSILADTSVKTREDICAALKVYGHCLLAVQREALEDYCK